MGGIDLERAHLSSFLSTHDRKDEMALWLVRGITKVVLVLSTSSHHGPILRTKKGTVFHSIGLGLLTPSSQPCLLFFDIHSLKKTFQVQFTWAAFWLRLGPLPTFLCHHPYLENSFWLSGTLPVQLLGFLSQANQMNMTMYSDKVAQVTQLGDPLSCIRILIFQTRKHFKS